MTLLERAGHDSSRPSLASPDAHSIRVLQAGQIPEGMSLTPHYFARGNAPEMSVPGPQIARGFPNMTPQNFGDSGFTL
jgi:hypothetical protein